MRSIISLTALWLALILAASPNLFAAAPKEATPATKAANGKVLETLPFADGQDYEDARRGFIAALDPPLIEVKGRATWDLRPYDFLKEEQAPATVNPSLWRMARLNLITGLFKLTGGLYQVRGLDLSNMTIIEGDTGLIIIDPLTDRATARAALDLYYQHVPGPGGERRPVKAVIYSHPHVDHYGGVKGVVTEAEAGQVSILAPEGFLAAAVSENVLAGNAMSRRATYMYGAFLPRGPRGHVSSGLGIATPRGGDTTLIPPTDTIKATGETRTIDGVEIEFQMADGTEAPVEILMYFPQFKALCAAEDATHTLHNLYTLRGAQVRDANRWWRALDEALELFGDRTEIIFAQHHWPRWGNEDIKRYLADQRDGYKFLHDQTLRLINQGYTPREISEMVRLPKSLERLWHLRGYYGTVSHDVKAIYQYYMGWYDSHPSNLNPLPPTESARRYVEFMGGADEVVAKARKSFDQGDYRWVAEVLRQVVFASPDHAAARDLLADALEQLGYQAESGPWRDEYLTGAQELRDGPARVTAGTDSPDVIGAMTTEMMLDFMSTRLDGERAEGLDLKINWRDSQTGERYALWLRNSVLIYKKGRQFPEARATLSISRLGLMALVTKTGRLDEEIKAGRATVEGDRESLNQLFGLMDTFERMFPIVTPQTGGKRP